MNNWRKELRSKYRQHLTPNIMTLHENDAAVDVFCQKDGSLRAEHFSAAGNIRRAEEIPSADLLALLQMYHDMRQAGESSAYIYLGGRYKHQMREYQIVHETEKGAVVA